MLLDQREFLLDLSRLDQARARPECFSRGHLALDFFHAAIVADARDFEAAYARIMAHLLVEIDGVERRPARQEIVAGCIAEVRSMRGRPDIGRNARLVDADDVVPAALDQVMGDRRADDTAKSDDDDLRLFRKLCHCPRLQSGKAGALAPVRMAHNMQRTAIGLPPVCDTAQVRRDPTPGLGSGCDFAQAKAQISSAWKPTW